MTMSFDLDGVQGALRKAWSLATASQWTASNPAAGQCNVTSLLIHDLFGGEERRALASEKTADSLRARFGADAVTSGRALRAKSTPKD